jgi:hypothetical protein
MSTDLHDLHDFLDQTLADLDVPTDRIGAGAMARGRVVRRRRRVAGVLGAAAVTVLAAGLALPSIAGTDEAGNRIAHDGGEPTHVGHAGWWDMPGAVMRDRLAELLPEGMRVTDANLGDEELAPGEEPTGGWVAIDVADEDGPAGSLNVLLYPPFDDDGVFARDVLTCPGNYEAGPDVECTEVHDADGDIVGRGVRWGHEDVVNLEVTRLLPDGAIVYAASSNSSDAKPGVGSSTDRARPPVGLAELALIAQDPTWQAWPKRNPTGS